MARLDGQDGRSVREVGGAHDVGGSSEVGGNANTFEDGGQSDEALGV